MFRCVKCLAQKLDSERAMDNGDICFPCMDAYARAVEEILNQRIPQQRPCVRRMRPHRDFASTFKTRTAREK